MQLPLIVDGVPNRKQTGNDGLWLLPRHKVSWTSPVPHWHCAHAIVPPVLQRSAA